MQRQVTLHFISPKNTISRLEQIEPLVTIVLQLERLVRVESPLSRLEQVVSIGHAGVYTSPQKLINGQTREATNVSLAGESG